MSYLFQIFWRHSWDVPTLVPDNSKNFVYLSVCSLPHFLTEIWLSLDISSCRWAIFFKFVGDIPGILLHYFKIISDFLYFCRSVHCLTFLLKLLYLVPDELSFFKFLGFLYNNSNNFIFFVCLSVCSLPHFITKIMLTVGISSYVWASILRFSGHIPWMSVP